MVTWCRRNPSPLSVGNPLEIWGILYLFPFLFEGWVQMLKAMPSVEHTTVLVLLWFFQLVYWATCSLMGASCFTGSRLRRRSLRLSDESIRLEIGRELFFGPLTPPFLFIAFLRSGVKHSPPLGDCSKRTKQTHSTTLNSAESVCAPPLKLGSVCVLYFVCRGFWTDHLILSRNCSS